MNLEFHGAADEGKGGEVPSVAGGDPNRRFKGRNDHGGRAPYLRPPDSAHDTTELHSIPRSSHLGMTTRNTVVNTCATLVCLQEPQL